MRKMVDLYMQGMIEPCDDRNILIANQGYFNSGKTIDFTYNMSDPRLIQLREKYNLEKIAGTGSDFFKLMRITYWVAKKLLFGYNKSLSFFHALDVFELTEKGFRSNCFVAATILTECFLALNYPARMVRCMPIDIRFNECHCMTIAYLNDEKRFVAFDSAMGGFYQNSFGIPMGISDIRESVITQQPFKIRSIFQSSYIRAVESYLSKNLVRFQSHQHTKYGNETENYYDVMVNLNPITLPIKDKETVWDTKVTKHIFLYNDTLFWEKGRTPHIIK